MESKLVWRIVLFIAVSFLFAACSKESNDDTDVKPRAIVKVASAYLGDMDAMISTTGSFEVLRDEKIKSTIAGKVEKVVVLEGDVVQKGAIVATIVSQESYAAIAGATQLLNQATTEAEKKQAEEALHLAETTAASAKISAPFSGAVIHRFVAEGELVSQGTDLVEIIDPSTEYFVAVVPINYLSSIRTGQAALVTIPGMTIPPLHGTVQAINPATDPNSQSIQVRINLRSIPSKVAAGTFGNVRIKIGEHRSAVLVPKGAVYHDDERNLYFVWRVQGDSLALMTQVDVGLSDSSRFEITSGIKAGDVVAIAGGYGLPDSTDVTVSAN
ncbi:MAG TPA: efflux RND transporter periplasmic adaptor subunit [Candidatus Acidoferrales bacterium]|nr:efflux RND transporter periplasmic adaptor subunit [Candidatus Acidoferrales bacterium]